MIDYATILFEKFDGSRWTLNGDDYEGLTWLSDTPKPTKEELDDLWDEVLSDLQAKKKAKEAAKAAAQAKLAALGLTLEDLQALGL
jgi:hypothetical protein